MSHELRTPLNAIIGFSEVLVQGLFGDVNAKQREYLQDVIGSGQHLLSLINDILDLAKIEAGRMELELSTFSFRSALQSGVTIVRERAARNGITLNVDVSDELDRVEADERKVKQILYNLLSNAVKFTPDGGNVNVTVRRDNGDVRVDVQDNGIGIARGGSGADLRGVPAGGPRTLARGHRAGPHADEAIRGAARWAYLARKRARTGQHVHVHAAAAAGRAGARVKELILIVEDNDKNLKLTRDLLRFHGFETIEATNAEDGIALARDRKPRPGADGHPAAGDGRRERAPRAQAGRGDGRDPRRRPDRVGDEGGPRALRQGRVRRLHHQADLGEGVPRPGARLHARSQPR